MKLNTKLILTSLAFLGLSLRIAPVTLAYDIPQPPTVPTAPPPPENTTTPPPAPTAPPVPVYGEPEPTSAPAPTDESQPAESDHRSENEEPQEQPEEAVVKNESESDSAPTNEQPASDGESSSGNVGDTAIETGDANSTATLSTEGNNNLSLTDPAAPGGATVINDGNGSGSDNTGSVGVNTETTTFQTNTATVVNGLTQDADTGHNDASRNVGESTIETGDANTTGTIITAVNTNVDGVRIAEFNIADDHVGDIILDFSNACIYGCGGPGGEAANTNNGADSTNDAALAYNANTATFQTNEAIVENNMALDANSGYNEADRNTAGDSAITTGDANIAANVLTMANNNFSGNVVYGVVNIFGELIGDIIFPEEALTQLANTNNGADSTNNASYESNAVDTTMQFNVADITNTLTYEADTGNNDISKNTGGDNTVKTGDSSITAAVTNIANMNIVGDMWLVLIQDAGKWLGKIMGAQPGATMAGSEGIEFTVLENGEVVVTNSGNGAGSNNTASLSDNTNSTLVQSNAAKINNNLDLSANTGNNSTSRNTGGNNSITTGDANIMANVMNFVNNNISGSGRLFVTVVNVFGWWTGNFVGPGAQKEAPVQPQPLAYNANPPVSTGSGPAVTGRGGYVEEQVAEEETEEAESETTAQTYKKIVPRRQVLASAPFSGAQVLGETTELETAAPVASQVVQTGVVGSASARKTVKINLAWLLLLSPVAAVAIVTFRRKAKI